MKEIVLKLYEFDELSKDSQERIIERERWNVMEQCMDAYSIEYQESMKAFEGLREYSLTIPSGEYEGKMWKVNRGGIWYLYWYDHDDNPSMIKIERREILLLN